MTPSDSAMSFGPQWAAAGGFPAPDDCATPSRVGEKHACHARGVFAVVHRDQITLHKVSAR